MRDPVFTIIQGMMLCALSLVLWHLTRSHEVVAITIGDVDISFAILGWAFLFLPGSVMIFWGIYRVLREG